jgi:hypothetical protein
MNESNEQPVNQALTETDNAVVHTVNPGRVVMVVHPALERPRPGIVVQVGWGVDSQVGELVEFAMVAVQALCTDALVASAGASGTVVNIEVPIYDMDKHSLPRDDIKIYGYLPYRASPPATTESNPQTQLLIEQVKELQDQAGRLYDAIQSLATRLSAAEKLLSESQTKPGPTGE